MKKALKTILIILAILFGLFYFGHVIGVDAQSADKFDGECTGQETVGRCADKCPDGSYEIGTKDETGEAICKLEPTGCPYGDSIPLGADCDKHAPQTLGQSSTIETDDSMSVDYHSEEFIGK